MNGRPDLLQQRTIFDKIEVELYRMGPEAYIVMKAAMLDRLMDAIGGIGPYSYSCTPLDDKRFIMHIQEVYQ